MTFSLAFLRLMFSALLGAAALAVAVQTCVADTPAVPPTDQPRTDHIVGDTAARGIEFVLKPAHVMLSNACFWIVRPAEPRHITAVYFRSSPVQEQSPPQHQDETSR